MENKYYTPKIEEFYVGFEFEFHGMTTGGLAMLDFSKDIGNPEKIVVSKPDYKVWTKEVFTHKYFDIYYRRLEDVEKLIEAGQIRVKYLDREDIESLGWIHTGRSIDDWFKWE
jgi:hypothetical protein